MQIYVNIISYYRIYVRVILKEIVHEDQTDLSVWGHYDMKYSSVYMYFCLCYKVWKGLSQARTMISLLLVQLVARQS